MSDWISKYLQEVIENARGLARGSGCDEFGTVHLLVALLNQPQNVAKLALAMVGCKPEHLLQSANEHLLSDGRSTDPMQENIQYRNVMTQAAAEARSFNNNYVGTEHLVIALAATEGTPARDLLVGHGADAAKLRPSVHSLLRGHAPPPQTVNTGVSMTRAPEPVGAYPPCRRIGNLLFISGQGPRQRGSKDIPGVKLDAAGKMVDYDMEAQVRAVMQNLRYILEENGSSWDRIADMTCFLTDMERDFAVYNRVYAEYFPPGPAQPCRTTIGIDSLPRGGSAPIAFEVKAIATIG